ncbi:hypothetical protein SAMN05519103_05541 [Rhizobiales bacterium GAS113]|nr:hypothetical protein SAMN05519103_05541 [Rhizobiales bacterium GAS113]
MARKPTKDDAKSAYHVYRAAQALHDAPSIWKRMRDSGDLAEIGCLLAAGAGMVFLYLIYG